MEARFKGTQAEETEFYQCLQYQPGTGTKPLVVEQNLNLVDKILRNISCFNSNGLHSMDSKIEF